MGNIPRAFTRACLKTGIFLFTRELRLQITDLLLYSLVTSVGLRLYVLLVYWNNCCCRYLPEITQEIHKIFHLGCLVLVFANVMSIYRSPRLLKNSPTFP